jgi:hypothetical protein
VNDERLWRYSRLTRLWAQSMIAAALLVLCLAVVLEVSTGDGLRGGWLAVFGGVGLGTLVVCTPLVRLGVAPPSSRLPEAEPNSGPRRIEPTPGEWRRWTVASGAVMAGGATAMLMFLVAILGRGGTAEGVVVGLLAAWGIATFVDARQIERTEQTESRHYYAAVRRPTAVGRHLVWERQLHE